MLSFLVFAKLHSRRFVSPPPPDLCGLTVSVLDRSCSFVLSNFQPSTFDSQLSSKSFNCNTYASPRNCCKQETYVLAKPFRCNTYRKPGGPAFLRGMPSNSHFGTHLTVAYPPLFSITSTMPILQVLSFHIHACNGGYPLPNLPNFKPSYIPTCSRAIPSPFLPSHQSPVTNHESPVTPLPERLPVRKECIERTIGGGGSCRQTILRLQFRRLRLRGRMRWVNSLVVGSSSSRASPFFVLTNN
jgi:hypothetical protein